MKALKIISTYIFFCSMASAQQAPFCVVSQTGHQNCFYYSLDSCRQAATSLNGICATNSSSSRSQPVYPSNNSIQQPDIAGSFQRAYAEGQRRRLEQERHQAEMAYLSARTESARAETRNNTNKSILVIYKCPDANGQLALTLDPAPGCIVDQVKTF